LVSVVSLAFLFISYSSSNAQELIPGQTYNTNNIVTNTPSGGPSSWVNGVYQNSLTCWAWGNPGYCGPNAIVRPGNNINFSFGTTDLHQIQSVANILPNSGTGLQITGYTFGFTAKNGNGWDDGRVDQLNAYVNLYDRTGGVLTSRNYNLNYQFNWTTFNYNETFTTPYSASSVGNVRYGFIGRDNNFWAGPYGPEINNVSFSLKYSVDPCSVNVLSSPSCPGYLSAINSLTPPITTTSAPIVVSVATSTSLPTTADVPSSEVKVDAGGVEVSTTGTISAPDNVPQSVKESQKSEESKPAPNMNLIMSVVRQIQANDKATQEAAVQNALQEVSNAIANAQEQTNMVIANNQRTNERQQETIAAVSNSSAMISSVSQSQRAVEVQQPAAPVQIQMPKVDYSLLPTTISTTTFTMNRVESRTVEVEVQQTNVMGLNNPVNNILQQRLNVENTNTDQQTETVRSNVQPNELAGGVDISSIAVTPAGFNAYLNLALKDGQLYKPDAIYKNQVTIDNVRALRQLSSDRLHQQMVDQQYRN